ncbi:Proheparin-binding EGF-like growth factor [Myotis davidii]|uniref:Proheparin-binding EGF-like growth factor n=1 Tax=Myotis davidii TaxID=225400 RepID=L5LCT8_MYODS|nr:Proheparin-binding EGF-like growth factor [Myotis davidii]
MKLLPSVVLKLFLAAVLSALVTGESLERLRRGLAGGTSNLGSPTDSTDQLLPPGGVRGRDVLDLEGADLDLFRVHRMTLNQLSHTSQCGKP